MIRMRPEASPGDCQSARGLGDVGDLWLCKDGNRGDKEADDGDYKGWCGLHRDGVLTADWKVIARSSATLGSEFPHNGLRNSVADL